MTRSARWSRSAFAVAPRGSSIGLALALVAAALGGAACGGGSTSAPAPTSVTVPNVVGLTQAAAATALSAAGLSVGEVTPTSSATVPAGSVTSQAPAAGASVARATAVALGVSTGPATLVTPSLSGLTQAEAEDALVAAGLLVGTVTTAPSAIIPAGRVLSQVPAAGVVVLALSPVDLVVSSGPTVGPVLPPDPATVASPHGSAVATGFAASTAFLYQGPSPIQTGVAAGTIDPLRVAVLRGALRTRDGAPLPGALVTVLGHPEYGSTLSRADGRYDLAVNGGATLLIDLTADGYLPAQRQVAAPWAGWAAVPDAVLVPLDAAVTAVSSSAATLQVARATVSSDASGERRSTILFPAGTSASLLLADGTTVPAPVLHVRATEFTVGPSGPDAMPGLLPPTSGYTYALELSADEALLAGAPHVIFSRPVSHYVENFLGFPAGTIVPYGWYDRAVGAWKAGDSGVVLAVLGTTAGAADLDLDGSGSAASPAALAAIGIDLEERQALASLYAVGQSLWRVQLSHFSPGDLNWTLGPPPDAVPPEPPPLDPEPLPDPNRECGSVIGCETQLLGESLPVAGTPWRLHHQSDRTPGYRAETHLDIPLSGPTIPPTLRRISLLVEVAGRQFSWSYPAAAGLTQAFDFDGKDAYGRDVWGAQRVSVRIGFTYPGAYRQTARFAVGGNGLAVDGNPARSDVTVWRAYGTTVGQWNAAGLGLGGWSLSVHHAYDPVARRLYYGDGRQLQVPTATIETVVTELVNFTRRRQLGVVAVGQDGSLYLRLDVPNSSGRTAVARLKRDGLLVGEVPEGHRPVVGPDGSVYLISNYYVPQSIRRYPADLASGIYGGTVLAGPSADVENPELGDGVPATSARVRPSYLAVAQDGTVYFSELAAGVSRVRRIGTDGILTTVAGNGTYDATGDGGPATAAAIGFPQSLAVGPDGSLYVEDTWNKRIRRISPDGIITTVAGNGTPPGPDPGDGQPATSVGIDPKGLALSPDGDLTFLDHSGTGFYAVRMVRPDGTLTTLAGGGLGGDGPALSTRVYGDGEGPSLAWGPDRMLYLGCQANGPAGTGFAIRRIAPALAGGGTAEVVVPDDDGREAHVFDGEGRHLRTVDATTGALRHAFTYDAGGFLATVTDGSGNTTTVERAGGAPAALVGPFGHRTSLSVDGAGWLSGAADPTGATWAPTSAASGLLVGFSDPLGRAHAYAYDAAGRLIEDRGPGGAVTTLTRTPLKGGHRVDTASAMGRTRRYQVEGLVDGSVRRTLVDASGVTHLLTLTATGSLKVEAPDGTTTTVTMAPDPRWGMAAPVAATTTIQTPGGNTRTITATRNATLRTQNDPFSATALEETVTEEGQTWRFGYVGATRSWTVTSPAGRITTVQLDSLGRDLVSTPAGLSPTTFGYDSRGRLAGQARGARTWSFAAGGDGLLASFVDPIGRSFGYTRDLAGRITRESLPGGRDLGLGYDQAGQITTVTPPGRTAHALAWSPAGLIATITPPSVSGGGTGVSSYSRDADQLVTRVDLPDGDAKVLGWADPSGGVVGRDGRLVSSTSAAGTALFGWDGAGRLVSASQAGLSLALAYDGGLVTSQAWSGAVAGTITRTYDASHRPSTVTAGGVTAALTWDADGLLTGAGALSVTRAAATGLPTATALGVVTTSESFDGLGELAGSTAWSGAVAIYDAVFSRDLLGRITAVAETVQGTARTVSYAYDVAGRIASVSVGGSVTASYQYDGQGNRISQTVGGTPTVATFDAQDRLLASGSTSYGWTAAGALASRTDAGLTGTFVHDAQGQLRAAVLPDGRRLDYLVDGLGRRVGRSVNSVLVEAFLYDGDRPVAWLDGSGGFKAAFVYGPRGHAPDYLVTAAGTYRLVADHLGSPRLVVDAASGAVVQRLDYGAFGEVLADSSPGFQPFGFAGGLRDLDTGLVHFGARDYDPATGRWTSKDPLGFWAGDGNLYAYAGNDPVNWLDPSGLAEVCAVARHVRPGDTLFVYAKDVKLLETPTYGARPLTRNPLQPGVPVTYRGQDPADSAFVLVEVGGQAGYILRNDLGTRSFPVETLPGIDWGGGKPMSAQAFPSSGAGTKG